MKIRTYLFFIFQGINMSFKISGGINHKHVEIQNGTVEKNSSTVGPSTVI